MSVFVTVATWDPTRRQYDQPRVHVLTEHADLARVREIIEQAHAARPGADRCRVVRKLLRFALGRPELLATLRSNPVLRIMWRSKMREFRREPALAALCDESLRALA